MMMVHWPTVYRIQSVYLLSIIREEWKIPDTMRSHTALYFFVCVLSVRRSYIFLCCFVYSPLLKFTIKFRSVHKKRQTRFDINLFTSWQPSALHVILTRLLAGVQNRANLLQDGYGLQFSLAAGIACPEEIAFLICVHRFV